MSENQNLLLQWLQAEEDDVEARGFEVSMNEGGGSTTATAVDLEGHGVGGTICHWPPSTFEFYFIEMSTGKVLILETEEVKSQSELGSRVKSILEELVVA